MPRSRVLVACVLFAALGCGGRSVQHAEENEPPDTPGGTSGGGGTGGSGPGGTSGISGASGAVGTAGTGPVPTGGMSGTGGQRFCEGVEEDLLNSPLHCGSCFNDCQRGGCNQGYCSTPATRLTTYPNRRPATHGVSIALDDARVYVADADAGRILSISKDGGDERVLASALAEPVSVALSEEFVYFSTLGDSKIARVPKSGGNPFTIADHQLDARNLTIVARDIYWSAQGTILRAEVGVEADPAVVARPIGLGANDLVVTPTRALWILRDNGPDWDGIYAADRFGGGELGRVFPFSNLVSFTLFGQELYATTLDLDTETGVIAHLSDQPAALYPLATDISWPENIAVDDLYVYFSEESYNAIIRRVPRNGGPIANLASGHEPGEDSWGTVADLAIDDTRVFFASHDGIFSVPK